MKNILLTSFLLCMISAHVYAGKKNPLSACWQKQVKPFHPHYLNFTFSETKKRFYHSFEPWQFTNVQSSGSVTLNASCFFKTDSVVSGKNTLTAKTCFDENTLLYQDFGDTALAKVTETDFKDYLFETARYSPALLLQHFYNKQAAPDGTSNEFVTYTLTVNKTIVKIFIGNDDNLVHKITLLNENELYGFYGDVITTFTYSQYTRMKGGHHPLLITIDKINGKLTDEIKIANLSVSSEANPLLRRPENYAWKPEPVAVPDVKVEKYSEHIYLVNLNHTDARSLIVEFKDFLLVAEAALTISNGERIIKEAKKIAPGKPIRYFAFGHFHNWYLGGVRSFIHNQTTIFCVPENKSYLEYIAAAQHTLTPDSLQQQPTPLKTEVLSDSTTITDGEFEMVIYKIGKQSEHTNDYLLYYFPAEKMLFQGDLVWISKEGPLKKAGKRQEALYNAIKNRNLVIKEIIQSWPLARYNLKNIIPFSDLEQSVQIK